MEMSLEEVRPEGYYSVDVSRQLTLLTKLVLPRSCQLLGIGKGRRYRSQCRKALGPKVRDGAIQSILQLENL